MEPCPLCIGNEEFSKLEMKRFKFWRVSLNANQSYLGRCMIILNRHLEDYLYIKEKELLELFEISKLISNAIKDTFDAGIFNYTILGNTHRHIHQHIIPRYKTPTLFSDIEFKDDNWGRNYMPYNDKFQIPLPILILIKQEILKNI